MWALVLLPIALLGLGSPIFLLLLITAIAVLATTMQVPWSVLHQVMFGSVDKFSLLAVPFFIFAGELMAKGSMSQRIIDWVLTLLGGRRGAMPLTVVGASTVFGALSGSGPATVAAVGKLMYPNLRSRGYSDSFSGGLLAASGGIAVIVPPSIAMILYCVSAEQSVADLFLAGILPGLLIAALLAGYIFVFATQQDIREREKFDIAELWLATKRGVFALLAPIIILGGIYAGVFSPTEASGVACVYALVISLGVYRDVSLREIMDIAVSTATLTGQIMIIVAAAGLVSWLMTVQGIPQAIIAAIAEMNASPWVFLLTVNVLLLVVGCVIDPISAILVLAPLLVPIAQSLGINLVHFGLIMTVNLSIGMFTPPFGLNLFVAQATLGVSTRDLYRGIMPFIGAYLLGLILLTYVPEISLFLLNFR